MMRVGQVTVVVPDYDEAIEHYVGQLGFALVEDTRLDEHRRWVVVSPSADGRGARLLLAKANGVDQRHAIGNQAGGRVLLFLYTDAFTSDHARLVAAGVTFLEDVRHEPYGRVAVFQDRFGNRWDLLEEQRGE